VLGEQDGEERQRALHPGGVKLSWRKGRRVEVRYSGSLDHPLAPEVSDKTEGHDRTSFFNLSAAGFHGNV
jgi:hypothetical protein